MLTAIMKYHISIEMKTAYRSVKYYNWGHVLPNVLLKEFTMISYTAASQYKSGD